ncbi:Asp-tRNA(Asn)/Glu-tRNA(Gln) amidotransferase subunit GatC [Alkaliphilus sp. MSJ-5]|uniref:Asp-tRNA(Asn)/Glu-tRNA(Gln) amidotransferase subunit GatC n=1 Tax=Alkaliphilus flagellatus TaxID=2841507 RepID=A0ABS6G8V7_9FIRM|nr:Asp-tRNA(Asn)/Glu-tRNA(Gln) amidotransferase subunit GatC [Alkaliphilus flagellatus]MBU5678028.1 Asp-tRNA(Asn)/Glu-tRNA(Gln) amidotransferase subunit GatC [Alkaliphilus flagellatus]
MDSIISLAKLTFSEGEKEALREHMGDILNYVEILKEIDAKIENLDNNFNKEFAVLREDKVESSFNRESILGNASSKKDGYFLIPNILD